MLDVTNVSKHYGALAAVRNITFSARPGEVLGSLDPDGSGKSTIVKMLAGLMTPTSGEILYDGRNIHEPGWTCGCFKTSFGGWVRAASSR